MYENHPSFELPENSEEKTIWRYMDLPKFISLIDKKSLFLQRQANFGIHMREPFLHIMR